LGPFVQYQFTDRLGLRLDTNIGLYRMSFNNTVDTLGRFGAQLAGEFRLLPSVSLFAFGGYSWYNNNPVFNTVSIGAGVNLNLQEILRPQARVRGEKIEQYRVFPVSYAWYEKNSVAKVRITNNEPNTITNVNLTFFLERYMKAGTVFAGLPRLLPGESAEFPVTALFNESMLDLTENINSNPVVIIDYQSLGAKRQASFPVQMPIYHRNAFVWDDDRRAAAFVSARVPAASLFAKYTASAVRRSLAENPGRFGNVPQNVLLAAALFEALNLYGINYVIDPASSYVELSENPAALDSLNYPYQTLMYRGGDCDDLSILYCSLLEVLDIPTAFITVPGHIYAAFDTGIQSGLAFDSPLIEYGGKLWAPVEITVPGEGFAEAWRIGGREWQTAGEERRLYPMQDSWELYQPVSVPGAGERLPEMPEEREIVRRLTAEMGILAGY
jgi:hypothetical protein